jgi:hypothetical protein
LRVVDLNVRDTYITPRGLRCRLKSMPAHHARTDQFLFVYLDAKGAFNLKDVNVYLLTKVADVAPAW